MDTFRGKRFEDLLTEDGLEWFVNGEGYLRVFESVLNYPKHSIHGDEASFYKGPATDLGLYRFIVAGAAWVFKANLNDEADRRLLARLEVFAADWCERH